MRDEVGALVEIEIGKKTNEEVDLSEIYILPQESEYGCQAQQIGILAFATGFSLRTLGRIFGC